MSIKVCARCLYSETHPLNLIINAQGLCSGCAVHEEKDVIDWGQRRQNLSELLAQYRCHSGNNYDCIIPVSGGRDSYFIVDYVKNEMGMNPLLVTYNQHYNTDRGIRNLAYLRTLTDSDIFTLTVSPDKVKKITRATLRRLGSVYWHVLAGQSVFPVQIAVRLKIPLIIWGCHQGMDQVGMFSHNDGVEMTRRYRHEHDLMGLEAEDLLSDEDQIFERDIYQYLYPDNDELAKVGVRGIYLNNYLRWDTKKQHEAMILKHGYESASQRRTFDTYNDVDSFIYTDLHDHIKALKWGYSKVTDHACREIRFGRISREDAKAAVAKFSRRKHRFEDLFLDWIGMRKSALRFILDQHRHPDIWCRDAGWAWKRSDKYQKPSAELIEQHRLKLNKDHHFTVSPSRRQGFDESRYELYAKGHVMF